MCRYVLQAQINTSPLVCTIIHILIHKWRCRHTDIHIVLPKCCQSALKAWLNLKNGTLFCYYYEFQSNCKWHREKFLMHVTPFYYRFYACNTHKSKRFIDRIRNVWTERRKQKLILVSFHLITIQIHYGIIFVLVWDANQFKMSILQYGHVKRWMQFAESKFEIQYMNRQSTSVNCTCALVANAEKLVSCYIITFYAIVNAIWQNFNFQYFFIIIRFRCY